MDVDEVKEDVREENEKQEQLGEEESADVDGDGDDGEGEDQSSQQQHGEGSEFRVQLQNLSPYISHKQLRNMLLKKLDMTPKNLKKIRLMRDTAYINFDTEESADNAVNVLNGLTLKNKQVIAKRIGAAPLVRKPARTTVHTQSKGETENKNARDTVTPLWNMPYEEQLKMKHNDAETLTSSLLKQFKQAGVSSANSYSVRDLLHPVRPSPKNVAYRNKCEFTVGRDSNGDVCVGFVGGRFNHGKHTVQPIVDCTNISNAMKRVVAAFQDFVIESKLAPFDEFNRVGFWKMLTVREFSFDLMIIATATKSEMDTPTVRKALADRFLSLSTLTQDEFRVTSVYWQTLEHASDPVVYDHLGGAPYVYETMLDCRFRVSPAAFFQTNSSAAEVLYRTIGEVAQLDDQSLLLDICCGTGTIGICLAKSQKTLGCVGVEIIKEAVEDARINAQANKLDNVCRFICGRAEEAFNVLKYSLPAGVDLDKTKLVGVLDPPRAGLHAKLVNSLRKMTTLKRIVYVSCEPRLAMKNFIDLARPESNRFDGDPFVLKSITPVDMFPQTTHCEWVLLFER
uniref:tRNA (uracil(54)-C(5))-methyltransferase n=1 Tax=Plectus sambesii TaxID=2011161 RepID=A0A914WXR7_9BILA